MNVKPRNLSIKQRGLNFEMLMWIFTRLSALAMYAFSWPAWLALSGWGRAIR